jgi:uncharacterized membrane protein
MSKNRLEAFSDGVIAILITIMVLELHIPDGDDLEALRPLIPTLSSYVLSFVFLGIYWNNHHHLLQASSGVNGSVLWANLHLLFWLSLIPFATGWMGDSDFAGWPVALYGFVLWMAAAAYTALEHFLIRVQGPGSVLAAARGSGAKDKLSLLLLTAAIPAAFLLPWLSVVAYVAIAVIWFIPDRRLEGALT